MSSLASVARLELHNLRPNPGAHKAARRVGRGQGSGRGKTSGRGQKGQKARQGGSVRHGFEGGQTPLHKRLPKRGDHAGGILRYPFQTVQLEHIQRKVDIGQLDPLRPITIKSLWDVGLVSRAARTGGVKVLQQSSKSPTLTPFHLEVSSISRGATQSVLTQHGTVKLVYHNALGLRAALKPEKWTSQKRPLPRWARPPPRLQAFYNKGWSQTDEAAPAHDASPPWREVTNPNDVIRRESLPRAEYMRRRHRERSAIRRGIYSPTASQSSAEGT